MVRLIYGTPVVNRRIIGHAHHIYNRCVLNKGFFVEPLSCSHHTSPTQSNYHATLIRDVVNMSIGPAKDCCFKKAIGLLMKYRDMALVDGSNSNGNGNCDGMT
jgi:hypothetical protein